MLGTDLGHQNHAAHLMKMGKKNNQISQARSFNGHLETNIK